MSKLIIVESPGKIKKIKSFLGPEYTVMASVGHIRDLAKDSISVDPSNNFKPTYQIMSDKKKVVSNLKKFAACSSEIIIASDSDREGEAIAYHLIEVLGIKEYKRIIFNEITKLAINKALENPRKVDMNMFYSQQTRRILDRIVGYKLSPILKSIPGIITNNLGTGRVQSVVTRLIVDKEKQIQEFLNLDKSTVYNINANFNINGSNFKATYIYTELINDLININKISNLISKQQIKSYKEIKSVVKSKDDIKIIVINIRTDTNFIISNVNNSDHFRHPPLPFITSSLQQEASYKLKFQLKQTMNLAQKLYEKGLITYMRTDSPALSAEALNYIKKYIIEEKDLGEKYYQFRQFKTKNQNAQEAHEAIRPTHFNIFELTNYKLSNTNEEKLYQLIWNRTIASQMKPAKYYNQHLILSNKTNIKFEGTNTILIFDGYLKLYKHNSEIYLDDENNDISELEKKHIKINDKDLKSNNIKWSTVTFKETFLSSPSRYNEPSLVKKLESLGIGRPSTYASIISKIQEHKYITISNIQGIEKQVIIYTLIYMKKEQPIFEKKKSIQKIGNEKLRLIPTSDGELITNYLIKNFQHIMDYDFTAKMETLLDDIAKGNKIWYDVLKDFYNVLKQQFIILGLNIELSDSIFKNQSNNNNNNKCQIIGLHPKYGDINYIITRFGPTFKINLDKKTRKDLFVKAGKLDPIDPKTIKIAIKYIDYKINNFK
jgi:DNA topoisomerase-1